MSAPEEINSPENQTPISNRLKKYEAKWNGVLNATISSPFIPPEWKTSLGGLAAMISGIVFLGSKKANIEAYWFLVIPSFLFVAFFAIRKRQSENTEKNPPQSRPEPDGEGPA
jgi:hypothetical protein